MMKTGLIGAVAVLVLTGCSSAPAPSPAPVEPSAPVSPVADPPSPSPTTPQCPAGAYILTALEGRGPASALGKGTGGDIAAEFADGSFVISSDGSEPVVLDVGPSSAQLRFDGRITGTYAGDSSALRLSTTKAEGEATVKGFGFTQRLPADQLLGQGATARVVCDDAAGTAVVTLPDAALTLTRS